MTDISKAKDDKPINNGSSTITTDGKSVQYLDTSRDNDPLSTDAIDLYENKFDDTVYYTLESYGSISGITPKPTRTPTKTPTPTLTVTPTVSISPSLTPTTTPTPTPLTLSAYSLNTISNLATNKDYKSRYLNGTQANELYGLDLFLNFYQNNINSGSNDNITSTSSYIRNPNFWASGIDFTCCSPWNMHPTLRLSGGALTGPSHHRPVTLISPRHVLGVKHLDFYPPSGSYVRFVTKNNETITRTITNIKVIPDAYDSNADNPLGTPTLYPVDFIVGILDSDVPETISFAKVLPDNYIDKLQRNNILIVFKNQDQSIIIQKYNGYENSHRIGTTWDPRPDTLEDYSENIDNFSIKPSGVDNFSSFRLYDSGSPIFLIIDNEDPVLLGLVNQTGGGAAYPATTVNVSGVSYSYKDYINSAMSSLGGGYQLTEANLDNFPNVAVTYPTLPSQWQTLYGHNFLNFNGTNNIYTNYPTIDKSLVFKFDFLQASATSWIWIDSTTTLYDIDGYIYNQTNIISPNSYINNIVLVYQFIEGNWLITTSEFISTLGSNGSIYSTYYPFGGPWDITFSGLIDGHNAGDNISAYLSVNP